MGERSESLRLITQICALATDCPYSAQYSSKVNFELFHLFQKISEGFFQNKIPQISFLIREAKLLLTGVFNSESEFPTFRNQRNRTSIIIGFSKTA